VQLVENGAQAGQQVDLATLQGAQAATAQRPLQLPMVAALKREDMQQVAGLAAVARIHRVQALLVEQRALQLLQGKAQPLLRILRPMGELLGWGHRDAAAAVPAVGDIPPKLAPPC
jgi:hypothetical protein